VVEHAVRARPVVAALARLDPVPAHRIAQPADAARARELQVRAPGGDVAAGLGDIDVVVGLVGALECPYELEGAGRSGRCHAPPYPARAKNHTRSRPVWDRGARLRPFPPREEPTTCALLRTAGVPPA